MPKLPHPKPVVSIVIPTYNEESYLPQCLSALKHQKYPHPYEIVVVDNNSTDQTIRVAHNYRVKLVHEKRQGVTYAKNTGCHHARGRIIAVLDADNIPPPDWLATITTTLNNPQFALITGPYRVPDQSPFWAKLVTRLMVLTEKIFQALTGNTIHVWGGNLAFRKRDFDKTGGYDLDFGYGADEVKIRLDFLHRGRVFLVPAMEITTSSRRFKLGPHHFFIEFGLKHYFGNLIKRKLTKKTATDPIAIREEC